ncbi:WcaA Glycosyltransferases involved in cell wall biogenesis [Methylophilaceae bacterium]
MIKLQPKNVISVVTVVLNDVNNIELTIQSVLSQVECDVEYILIDGGSSDGTFELIKKYQDKIQYVCSEADSGIYFAMNKAIDVAHGEWIIFLNSGDIFSCPTVVRDIFFNISPDVDVIYGQHIVKYQGSLTRKHIPDHIGSLWKGMFFSHQAMFARVDKLKKNRFDCDFKLAADYEMVSKLFYLGCNFLYVPISVAVISAEGISDTRRLDVFREYARISAKYFPNKTNYFYFIWKRVDSFFRSLVKKMLPRKLILWIRAITLIKDGAYK